MIRHAGELTQTIELLRRVQGQTDNGYQSEATFERVATTRAKAEDATYREFYAAAASNVRSSVNYWIRWREGVEAGMWVRNLSTVGLPARIVQVHHQDFKRKWMLLRCEAVEGVDR